MIDEKTALLRNEANKLDELLHPVFDTEGLASAKVVAKGLTCISRGCNRTNGILLPTK
jgi:hypothetical protein